MKKVIYKIFMATVALVAIFSFGACRELAQNGDFSGQWQVLSMDYPDGTSVDPEGERYYCFYRDVAHLTSPEGTRVTGNLVYDEDAMKFSIQFPYQTVRGLERWGITFPDGVDPNSKGETAHFTINLLTSEDLIMTTQMGVVITCRKW